MNEAVEKLKIEKEIMNEAVESLLPSVQIAKQAVMQRGGSGFRSYVA